ncbi:MAG: radical SAM protein, partial [Candidatus Omnitrophota bacterium]|nr:radical SAM protein [Candidatus Omnitrophota bacterium]
MAKVLFVNPPSPDRYIYIRDMNRSGRRSREGTIWPQTSLAYLAASVKAGGYEVSLIDCIAEGIGWQKCRRMIEDYAPDYIVTNPISSIITNDLYVTYIGKALGTATIAVGPHVTALPEETLKKYPTLDFIIMGEAEVTVRELIDCLQKKGNLDAVEGIAFRKGKDIAVTPKRKFIENLDDLPIPLHEILPIKKYRLPYIGKDYTFVLSSRGCPYQCIFCRQVIMWERKVRTRSAKSIFEELKYIHKLGIRNFMFHSDTFTIDRDVVIELCRMITDSGLKLRWCCNSRVDTVDEEMLRWMKKAGCWLITYGIETASDKILQNAKKGGSATVENAKRIVRLTKKNGIKVWGYFIIGLPGETRETMKATSRFARRLPFDIVNFAVAAPYPGTEFYKIVKENGWLESDRWEDFDQNYSAIVSYPGLSSKDIIKGIRNAYLRWFLRPGGIYKFLKGISNLESAK